jgi:hypothetical protein
MSFYIAIFLFIASVIGGLILVITNKKMRKDRFLLLSSLHGILLFAFIASVILKKGVTNQVHFNYFLLIFICSGILISAVSWRTDIPKLFKYYFSLYLLTVPMFLISPSMLVNFLLTGKYTEATGPQFALGQRYFIQTQGTVMTDDSVPHYKLIRLKGMFHETIQRDVVFGGKLDSVRVLQFDNNSMIEVRGYISKSNFVEVVLDSSDITLPLKKKKPHDIEYKL